MTNEPEERPAQEAGPREPLVPRPAVLLISLVVVATLVWHIRYDAITPGYDGSKITFALAGLVYVVLGFDVGRWLKK